MENFFSEQQKSIIVDAIANAELNTSGEVKVHIDNKCKGNVLDVAAEWFNKLAMHKTELRNGVLFYLAVDDHKFAILGDKGINEKVPPDFWDTIRDTMLAEFKQNRFAEGLIKGIEMAGEKLKTHFPRKTDDINELSNDLSFEK